MIFKKTRRAFQDAKILAKIKRLIKADAGICEYNMIVTTKLLTELSDVCLDNNKIINLPIILVVTDLVSLHWHFKKYDLIINIDKDYIKCAGTIQKRGEPLRLCDQVETGYYMHEGSATGFFTNVVKWLLRT